MVCRIERSLFKNDKQHHLDCVFPIASIFYHGLVKDTRTLKNENVHFIVLCYEAFGIKVPLLFLKSQFLEVRVLYKGNPSHRAIRALALTSSDVYTLR